VTGALCHADLATGLDLRGERDPSAHAERQHRARPVHGVAHRDGVGCGADFDAVAAVGSGIAALARIATTSCRCTFAAAPASALDA
jgi:hypothetical protein